MENFNTVASNELKDQFNEIVNVIHETRRNVFRIANSALIDLYWRIGERLTYRINNSQWGDGVIRQLANYIAENTEDKKGFSDKNLWRMKQFYETYCSCDENLSAMLRQINWTNNLTIMSRCKSVEEKKFYLHLAANERLSTRELDSVINRGLYERTMIDKPKLSAVLREIAPSSERSFRDRYIMDFIGSKPYSDEYSMKKAIIAGMKDFVLEIGKDFLYMGQEYRVQVGSEDFRIDLLFFHRDLRCLVAFEIKMGRFHPADLGQLEFYLEALDRDVRKPHENPSIGILLCKDKDDEVVEYAMSRSLSPTLVAEYQLSLPSKKVLQDKIKELFDGDSRVGFQQN
ncbi:MAG: PDDEXK nuclease domain-containing protein [Muribaculaceae bacterium]|nr:PDDEXK nuclease domain-containing protein [Muribaculaceae bacterium]